MDYLIPETLETERLILRKFRKADATDIYAYYGDPDCMTFTVGRALNESESWRMMACAVGHWDLHQYGPYALALKTEQKVIGICGLWYPGDWPEPEIKWGLSQAYWGKGYAKEAALAVKAMISEYLPDLNPISMTLEDNHGSRHLALALGASLEQKRIFRDKPACVYRHSKD